MFEKGVLMRDIHNYEERLKNLIAELKTLTPKRKRLLLNYKNHCRAINLSKARTIKLVRHIKLMMERHKLPPEKHITKAKIYKIINSIDDADYKKNTKRDYKTALRQYLKYLKINKELRDIIHPGPVVIREPQELITEENMGQYMSRGAERLYVELSQEIGPRPGEMFNLTYNDIKRTDWGALVKLTGKTGTRVLPVIKCAGKLPFKHSNDYVFSFQYSYIYNKTKKMLKKQGKEDTYLYIFRKTRGSEVLAELPGQLANMYMGWTKDSKMPKTYNFINLLPGTPLIDAIRQMKRVRVVRQQEKPQIWAS